MAETLAEALSKREEPRNKDAMRGMDQYLASKLGEPAEVVYTFRVGAGGRLLTRTRQAGAFSASVFVEVVPEEPQEDLLKEAQRLAPQILAVAPVRGSTHDRRKALVVVVVPEGTTEPTSWTVYEPADGDIAERLGQFQNNVIRVPVVVDFDALPTPLSEAPAVVPVPQSDYPLVLDPRIKRMLRLAIASSEAVMLIGPPGTGKTTLLEEALAEAQADPESYGLAAPPNVPLVVTPEEGWTTRELVGGETVDDEGRLRFRPGHVLQAVKANRWLILDEANRADMDRIFGGLLTFLSHKPVVVGLASGADDAAPIQLSWSEDAACSTGGTERLVEGTGDTIEYRAGRDWRLLGTYNALDAHRVFRFGQALGRRFARVPVPAISVEDFRLALAPRLDDLVEHRPGADRQRIETILSGLYAAHLDVVPVVGPALFLSVPGYVDRGLGLSETDLDRLLAEGYLLGAGPLLAQLEGTALDAFHKRVVTDEALFSEEQWSFVASLLPALS